MDEAYFRRGGREWQNLWGNGSITLYWEPHSIVVNGRQEIVHSYTIDYVDYHGKDHRWRFPTLAQARVKWTELLDDHAVDIAKQALRLN